MFYFTFYHDLNMSWVIITEATPVFVYIKFPCPRLAISTDFIRNCLIANYTVVYSRDKCESAGVFHDHPCSHSYLPESPKRKVSRLVNKQRSDYLNQLFKKQTCFIVVVAIKSTLNWQQPNERMPSKMSCSQQSSAAPANGKPWFL